MLHKHSTSRYLEMNAIYDKINKRYYWDQIYRDIQAYVWSYIEYQKRLKTKRKELLHPIQVGRAFERIGIDLVGLLSITTQNNQYIIVATDYLTK